MDTNQPQQQPPVVNKLSPEERKMCFAGAADFCLMLSHTPEIGDPTKSEIPLSEKLFEWLRWWADQNEMTHLADEVSDAGSFASVFPEEFTRGYPRKVQNGIVNQEKLSNGEIKEQA